MVVSYAVWCAMDLEVLHKRSLYGDLGKVRKNTLNTLTVVIY